VPTMPVPLRLLSPKVIRHDLSLLKVDLSIK
jgi:hypothetical protein